MALAPMSSTSVFKGQINLTPKVRFLLSLSLFFFFSLSSFYSQSLDLRALGNKKEKFKTQQRFSSYISISSIRPYNHFILVNIWVHRYKWKLDTDHLISVGLPIYIGLARAKTKKNYSITGCMELRTSQGRRKVNTTIFRRYRKVD